MTINITPIEEMVSVKALKIARGLMDNLTNGRKTWKFPTETYKTSDVRLAGEISIGLDFYLGGSEVTCDGNFYSVSSLGYYHYIGA